jgi:hypothetical protein
MRFRLYKEHGAMNSKLVFDAFEMGLLRCGHTVVETDSDIDVIWSVLWKGRMKANEVIYQKAILENKPIIILEIGSLIRGVTWKVALNHINRLGVYGNTTALDLDRPAKLGIRLNNNPPNNAKILLATQQPFSLQWQSQLPTNQWIVNQLTLIRQYTDRLVVVRPHPRSPVIITKQNGVCLEVPNRVLNTYDDYDINYNYHCVVNHNSGPAVQAAINGSPVVCDFTSLAYPVSDTIENIDNPVLLDRDAWFLQLSHTEWTLDEIASGTPLIRILP